MFERRSYGDVVRRCRSIAYFCDLTSGYNLSSDEVRRLIYVVLTIFNYLIIMK